MAAFNQRKCGVDIGLSLTNAWGGGLTLSCLPSCSPPHNAQWGGGVARCTLHAPQKKCCLHSWSSVSGIHAGRGDSGLLAVDEIWLGGDGNLLFSSC